jgi:hypothetical protein
MSSLKKSLALGILTVFLMVPFGVSAQTTEMPERLVSLQAQIEQLVKMVALLQTLLNGMQGTVVTSASTGFTATPASGYAPLTVSFSDLGNISGMNYGDGTSCNDNVPDIPAGAPEPLFCHKNNALISHTYTKPGTYVITASRRMPSGMVGQTVVTVLDKNSTQASATIDQSSLGLVSSNPVIRGTASGTKSVEVVLISARYDGYLDWDKVSNYLKDGSVYSAVAIEVPVKSGKWKASLHGLSAGLYNVAVYDASANYAVLATGSVTVGDSTQIASIDVYSPNAKGGGFQIAASGTVNVEWKTSNIGSSITGIWLVDAQGSTVSELASNTRNDGTENVVIPANTAPGQYAIRVNYTPVGSPAVDGFSDYFTVKSSINAIASATIDQSSLVTTNGNPTITGSAYGTSDVGLKLTGPGGDNVYTSGSASVINGRWSVPIVSAKVAMPNGVLTPGTYSVRVFDGMNVYESNMRLLTTGTLVVSSTSDTSGVAPKCSVIATPKTITIGQSTTIRWVSTNATRAVADVIDSDSEVNGSARITIQEAGDRTYSFSFYGPGGSATCSVTVHVVPVEATSSAAITSGLTTTLTRPVIMGTAQNTSTVRLAVLKNGNAFDGIDSFPVTNGHWAVGLNNQVYAPGTYTVQVYDGANHLLTTGTLVVASTTSSGGMNQ